MSSEPGLGSCGLPIREQGDYSAPLQVADDAGVSVVAPPGPIINADNPERISWRTATASDHAKGAYPCSPAALAVLRSLLPVDRQAPDRGDGRKSPALP